MAIQEKVDRTSIDKIYLDPRNPRLGRRLIKQEKPQSFLLNWMLRQGVLDELAVSFIESGFWTQEALVVVREKVGGKTVDVAVEGNRRLAALKMLARAAKGDDVSAKWKEIAKSANRRRLTELQSVPFVRADSRAEVQAYLGFRHVSGIKEWNPAEKAEFISHLIDKDGLTYEQVMRRIGSKTTTVRQNYIAYRILLQMESKADSIDINKVEDRFSVLHLSLRSVGVQQFLGIDIYAEPKKARRPVPKKYLGHLAKFALWLFGNQEKSPIVGDSRDTDKFGRILESAKAIEYLERASEPAFDTAFRIAGGDEAETAKHVERAADELEEALGTAHHHTNSQRMIEAVERVARDALQLLTMFPDIEDELFEA